MKNVILSLSALFFSCSLMAQNISGTIYEDKNYGGGAGRSLAVSAGSLRAGTIIELYDVTGNFLQTTTSNASGVYGFSGLTAGTYKVRVVNSSVNSSRSGYISSLWPVQTFRTDAAVAGVTTNIVDRVGGEIPAEQDAPANTTSQTLAALNAIANQEVQSVAAVTVTSSISTTGVDFGFCFDVIVNVNDAGQGSYRQFLINATNLGDESSLNQSGYTWNAISTVNASQALPAGKETTIFMIADGFAHPGLRAGLNNLLSSDGVAVIITSATIYPPLAYSVSANPDNTGIDGGTQTANVGNTNNITLGTGGIVGVGADGVSNTGDEFVLSTLNGPEVEISGNTSQYPLEIFAANVNVRCISIHSNAADIHIAGGSNIVIEQSVIGATAISFTPPAIKGGSSRALIYFDLGAISATVQHNLIGFSTQEELRMRFWDAVNINYTITNNEIAGGIPGTPGPGPGIATNDNYTFSPNNASAKGSILIKGNLVRDCGPTAISSGVHYNLANANIFQTTIEENTLTRSSAGFQALFGSGNDILLHNIINNNRNMGVRVANRSADPLVVTAKVKISQNSIYNNGTSNGALDGLGIDLNEDHITANTGSYDNTLPNLRINYPIVTFISYSSGNIIVKGYIGTSGTKANFANSQVEIFKANRIDNNQAGEVIVGDGLVKQHGEGETYIGSIVTDANGDFTFSTATGLVHDGDEITLTATDINNNTSEFSPVVFVPAGGALPVKITSFKATAVNNTQVQLNWQAGNEINMNAYVIEWGVDGVNFSEQGKITATDLSAYQFRVIADYGMNYYRLKVVNKDGSFTYSDVCTVNMHSLSNMLVYPVPATDYINITIPASEIKKKASISLVDMSGKIVFKKTIDSMNQTEKLNIRKMSAGTYYLRVDNGQNVVVKPVMIIW